MWLWGHRYTHTDCWGGRDINAGCGVRDITVAVVWGHRYTLIAKVELSTLGVGARTKLVGAQIYTLIIEQWH
jgi:hypothetical protein